MFVQLAFSFLKLPSLSDFFGRSLTYRITQGIYLRTLLGFLLKDCLVTALELFCRFDCVLGVTGLN